MLRQTLAAAATAVILSGPAARANDFAPNMQVYLDSYIAAWAADPVILDALRKGNAATAGWTQDRIDAADSRWRAEVGSASTPTIDAVLSGPAAEFLRARVTESGGAITEVFIMDNHGLNVAASSVTSDMWQGDEAKFSETYGKGPGAVHFSDIELDESSQRYQGQISFTIVDPASGEMLGAMTVGVDAESLM